MSDGEPFSNQRQGFTDAMRPTFELKRETRKGVKVMFLAIIFSIINLLIGILRSIFLFNLYSSEMNYELWESAMFYIILISGIQGILLIFIFVLLLISIFFFHRGRLEFDSQHPTNVKWSTIFIISYIILVLISIFVFPLFLYSQPVSNMPLAIGISQVFTILSGFLLGISTLLLVRSFAAKQEKDLLYIFATGLIILPINDYLFEIWIIPFSSDITSYFTYSILILFIRLFISILALLAYYRISKNFDIYGRYSPKITSSFLPRPKPFANFISRFYSKPMKAFICIVIIALIFGAAAGASVYGSSLYNTGFGDDNFPQQDWWEPLSGYDEGFETLNEGEAKEFEFYVEGSVQYFSAIVAWEDEQAAPLRTNEPDGFSITVTMGDFESTITDENDPGGAGALIMEEHFDEDELFVGSIYVIITLEYAGDQTGPIGIGPSPLTIADNSNDFFYEIVFSYVEN